MVYTPINPDQNYDRRTFVKAMGKGGDLEQYIDAFGKNSNSGARGDLGGLIHDDSSFYAAMAADTVAKEAADAHSAHIRSIGGWVEQQVDGSLARKKGYVERNANDFWGKFNDSELVQLIHSVPLYFTGDEEIDHVVNLFRELGKIRAAQQNHTIHEYVEGRMKKMPEWMQESFSNYTSRDPTYVERAFESFAAQTQMDLAKALGGKTPNRTLITRVIKTSLAVADKAFDDEPNIGDKADIFEKQIRPYYLAMAETLYPREKKEQKLADDPDREERKTARKKLGMSV